MASFQLFFEGHRFQSIGIRGGRWPYEIETLGNGRRWQADKPLGFWRTFAEIDLESSAAVRIIFGRYGDPKPPERGVIRQTADWRQLKMLLMDAASAWEEPGADGISRITDEQKRYAALGFLDETIPPKAQMIGGRIPRPDNLRDFMLISAAFMLESSTPMARCQECRHWFGVDHAAMKFCSNACRLASHRRKDK